MNSSADRPVQPFLDEKGRPRVRVVLSPHGPTEYRTGQAILDVVRYGGDQSAPERELDRLSEDAGGIAFDATEADLRQATRSGFLRVRFSPEFDVVEVLRKVNTGPESKPRFDRPVLFPNTVFHIGSFTADPMRFASGVGADPMRFASLFGADPMRFANSSTARPAMQPPSPSTGRAPGPGSATVAILDTGIPAVGTAAPVEVDFTGIGTPLRERPDANGDTYLDIAAGHTTFIRTIIGRSSPTVKIMCEGVIHNDGDGDEADISDALQRVYDAVADKSSLILNLSFSGYYDGDVEPPMIAYWIRLLVAEGAVVVAAAGNNGACRRKFPAAMPEVLSVGSIGPCGPSSFSNHGPWVSASAPGEDLVSQFFPNFDGAYEPIVPNLVPDVDEFAGWAMWSGTSFSTPTVVGALAEIIEMHSCTATEAVDKLIGRPGLFRLPDYGVVVNRVF